MGCVNSESGSSIRNKVNDLNLLAARYLAARRFQNPEAVIAATTRHNHRSTASRFLFTTFFPAEAAQNVIFKDPCIWRGVLANRILPKSELLIEVFGGAKRVWLKALNASTRSANCTG